MKDYLEVQKRKLAIEQPNAKARTKKAEAALLAEETRIMSADLSLLERGPRAWFESMRKMVQDRDAVSPCC
ncbi:hypothetical protein BRADI_4g15041v3 [Brachypodium distachyon]|uniref:No apical meristem-associated C-terminal domain-containing protein n=1 Tax=Brachypodium distachyon TaxID=15368 RepID=A0A2K2CMX2_BRADI|nr:hypothetical protein BRADI_4g15041v3 [Brachypodium distachyon]